MFAGDILTMEYCHNQAMLLGYAMLTQIMKREHRIYFVGRLNVA